MKKKLEAVSSRWVPRRFGDKRKTGFCLFCGGRTRYVKGQRKLTGKKGDSLNWHPACYARFVRMWTKDLYREDQVRRCAVCRKVFVAAGRGAYRQKYCSRECQKEWFYKILPGRGKKRVLRLIPRQKRTCVVCGKGFFIGGGLGRATKKVCSKACRREWNHRLDAAWRQAHPKPRKVDSMGYQRTCIVCGKSFEIERPKEWQRNVCSLDCRKERDRRKWLAWRKANRERSNENQRNWAYQRYHSDPVFRRKLVKYAALRRARLRA